MIYFIIDINNTKEGDPIQVRPNSLISWLNCTILGLKIAQGQGLVIFHFKYEHNEYWTHFDLVSWTVEFCAMDCDGPPEPWSA